MSNVGRSIEALTTPLLVHSRTAMFIDMDLFAIIGTSVEQHIQAAHP